MAFPAVTLLDSFVLAGAVEEKPLSDGGKFSLIQGCVTTGRVRASEQAQPHYGASTSFTGGEDGAYWNVREFANPNLIVGPISTIQGPGERLWRMWFCVTNPTLSTKSGYRLTMLEPKEGVEGTLLVERCDAGVFTTILTLPKTIFGVGVRVGVQVTGGKIIVWRESALGAMSVIGEVADSKYTTGFVGLSARGNLGRIENISASENVVPHSHTLTPGGQGQSATKAQFRGHVFSVAQPGSFGPRVPWVPTAREFGSLLRLAFGTEGEELPFPEGFNEPGWVEQLGEIIERSKGVIGKTHQKGLGWGGYSTVGARFIEGGLITDPAVLAYVPQMSEEAGPEGFQEPYACVGCCVPSNTEHSGYFARVQRLATGNFKVTLEKWVNGVKTELASTELASTYFELAAKATFEPAGMMLTLVGGKLRLWTARRARVEPLTLLLEASDSTFTGGYCTLEALGLKTLISHIAVASMDGQAQLEAHPSVGQTLTAAQGSAATRGATIARTLSGGQAQAASLARAAARTLSAAQSQAASRLAGLTHGLVTTQGQSPTRTSDIPKALVAGQGQAATRVTGIARRLVLSATQVTSKLSATARTLSVGQPQAAVVAEGHARASTLGATQSQVASRTAAVARTLLSAASSAASSAAVLARALRTGQAQAATQAATVESGAHSTPHALSAAQGQGAGLERQLARSLGGTAQSTPTLGRSATRSLSVTVASSLALGRVVARGLTGTAASTASLAGLRALSVAFVATQGQVVRAGRAPTRALSTTTGSATTLDYRTIEVLLPPPVKMTTSSASTTATSEVATPTCEPSLGQSGLTSSVETTT